MSLGSNNAIFSAECSSSKSKEICRFCCQVKLKAVIFMVVQPHYRANILFQAMVNLLLITLLLSVFLNNAVDGARRSKSKESQTKSNSYSDTRLQTLSTKFLKQSLVPLTDSNYSKFVTQRPRDYVAVVMFTALGSRYSCTACKAALTIYVDVANLYYAQYDFNSSLPKDRLAFFIVDADTAGQTFEDMKLETVPRFYILPPRTESDSKLKLSDFEIENRYSTVLIQFYLYTTV
jgi:OST3 / OST6 family, transporter family